MFRVVYDLFFTVQSGSLDNCFCEIVCRTDNVSSSTRVWMRFDENAESKFVFDNWGVTSDLRIQDEFVLDDVMLERMLNILWESFEANVDLGLFVQDFVHEFDEMPDDVSDFAQVFVEHGTGKVYCINELEEQQYRIVL